MSDVGVAGPDPLEQVITAVGDTEGTESAFYVLGTPRTFGTQDITAEVEFTVTGDVVATIGPVRDTRVTVPPHEHYYIQVNQNKKMAILLFHGIPLHCTKLLTVVVVKLVKLKTNHQPILSIVTG